MLARSTPQNRQKGTETSLDHGCHPMTWTLRSCQTIHDQHTTGAPISSAAGTESSPATNARVFGPDLHGHVQRDWLVVAWFLRAIELGDGRWACRRGLEHYDIHDQLTDSLTHLRVVAQTLGPTTIFVHKLGQPPMIHEHRDE